jgi:transcriptional regulator GlxA family with amidase domain
MFGLFLPPVIFHLVLDGVMEGALGLGLDVVDTAARLARAGRARGAVAPRTLEQRVVSIDGRPVLSVQRRTLSVDGPLSMRSVRRGDVLVVPGIFATSDSSVERLLGREDVQAAVKLIARATKKGAVVTASCSGTFLLARAGLLDGQPATTTWWLLPFFARRFPSVDLRADRMIVEGRAVITAGSAFAHADLMLAIVARLTSPSLSSLAASYLVLDGRTSQSRYMVMEHLKSFDPMLERLERVVVENLDRQLQVRDLARAIGTSARTLARRVDAALGTSPQRFVQRVRVSRAAHLLETTRDSVETVAARVGYADPAAFRRVFRAITGESPRGRR